MIYDWISDHGLVDDFGNDLVYHMGNRVVFEQMLYQITVLDHQEH